MLPPQKRCLLLTLALLSPSPQPWHRCRSPCVLPPVVSAKPQGMYCWQAGAMGEAQPPLATHRGVTPPPLWMLASLSPSALDPLCKADFGSQSARTGWWGSLPSDGTPCYHIAEGTSRTSAVFPSSTRQRKVGEGWSMLLHAAEFYCVQTRTKKLRKACWLQLLLLRPCKVAFLASSVRRAQAALGWECGEWQWVWAFTLLGRAAEGLMGIFPLILACCSISAIPSTTWLNFRKQTT